VSEDDLKRSALFGELPEDALAKLVAAGEEVHLPRGAVLISEGSPTDAMYLVRSGELAITKRAGDADVLVNVTGPGELVGELGLIHRRPRSATVSARTDATVLRIGTEALDTLLAHPEAARALLVSLTGRLDQQELLLRHHERMAALGILTAGLLHELNNPAAAGAAPPGPRGPRRDQDREQAEAALDELAGREGD
jgi:CRP-like cAMP-binding protein